MIVTHGIGLELLEVLVDGFDCSPHTTGEANSTTHTVDVDVSFLPRLPSELSEMPPTADPVGTAPLVNPYPNPNPNATTATNRDFSLTARVDWSDIVLTQLVAQRVRVDRLRRAAAMDAQIKPSNPPPTVFCELPSFVSSNLSLLSFFFSFFFSYFVYFQ